MKHVDHLCTLTHLYEGQWQITLHHKKVSQWAVFGIAYSPSLRALNKLSSHYVICLVFRCKSIGHSKQLISLYWMTMTSCHWPMSRTRQTPGHQFRLRHIFKAVNSKFSLPRAPAAPVRQEISQSSSIWTNAHMLKNSSWSLPQICFWLYPDPFAVLMRYWGLLRIWYSLWVGCVGRLSGQRLDTSPLLNRVSEPSNRTATVKFRDWYGNSWGKAWMRFYSSPTLGLGVAVGSRGTRSLLGTVSGKPGILARARAAWNLFCCSGGVAGTVAQPLTNRELCAPWLLEGGRSLHSVGGHRLIMAQVARNWFQCPGGVDGRVASLFMSTSAGWGILALV